MYLTNTHPASYRCGDAGLVVGAYVVYPDGSDAARACYAVQYADGHVDYVVVADSAHYWLTSVR